MKRIKQMQAVLVALSFLIISCSCASNGASSLSITSSPRGTIQKTETGYEVAGVEFGISENELFSALELKEDDFEKKINPDTKGSSLVLGKNPTQWEEVKDAGFVSMYHFSEKDELNCIDYQIYWNGNLTQTDGKWTLNVTETDGVKEIENAKKLLAHMTEQFGEPTAPVDLEILNQPNGSVTAQWFDMESETPQKALLAVFYSQTNPVYDNKRVYGVDITVSA